MGKTSGKTKGNQRAKRSASSRQAAGSATSFFGGMKGVRELVVSNFDNRRIPTIFGLVLLAFFIVALLSLITFLFSHGSDQSLISASQETLTNEELSRQVTNIFGLPGARLADYLFNQLFGWGIVFILTFVVFVFAHLIWRPRIAFIRYVVHFLIDSFLTIWTAIAAAGLQTLFPSDSFLRWGGLRGEELFTYIYSSIGVAGVFVALGFSLLIFLVLCSGRVLGAVQSPKIPRPNIPRPSFPAASLLSRLLRRKGAELTEVETDRAQQDEDAVTE